jgi:hypothetical protein
MSERAPEPVESGERAERTEITEQQRLDDATYEPQAAVEQTGDYRQAESIQNNFVATEDNAGSAAAVIASAESGDVYQAMLALRTQDTELKKDGLQEEVSAAKQKMEDAVQACDAKKDEIAQDMEAAWDNFAGQMASAAISCTGSCVVAGASGGSREPGTKAEAVIKAEAGAQAETGAKTESGARATIGSPAETGGKAKVGAQAEADASGAQSKARAQPGSETDGPMGIRTTRPNSHSGNDDGSDDDNNGDDDSDGNSDNSGTGVGGDDGGGSHRIESIRSARRASSPTLRR